MDKIQAAIAKARAARELAQAQGTAEVPAAAATAPAAQPVSPDAGPATAAAPAAGTDTQAARAAAWKPLATFAPAAKQMARNRIVTFGAQANTSPGAVSFDMLRTRILQQMQANGWKRLAITSPGAECGKSTVTLNLAFSLAKQTNIHTIVAEMDMRRPSLARTLGVKGTTSFATVLEGKTDFASVAMRPRPNVALGMNFNKVRNPAELLQSPGTGTALAAMEERYQPDLTIFDMPPMLVSDDAMAFMGQVDCVLLVAAAGSTSLREIDVCERDLETQTEVLGVVLNKCRYMEKDYGYGGYA